MRRACSSLGFCSVALRRLKRPVQVHDRCRITDLGWDHLKRSFCVLPDHRAVHSSRGEPLDSVIQQLLGGSGFDAQHAADECARLEWTDDMSRRIAEHGASARLVDMLRSDNMQGQKSAAAALAQMANSDHFALSIAHSDAIVPTRTPSLDLH